MVPVPGPRREFADGRSSLSLDKSYRAMQVARPGALERVERATPEPGPGQVLVAVDACGVCGADIGDIERTDPAVQPPRVPGHEVVGRIAAIGAGTPSIWRLGQRVGVGRLGGPCQECAQCRRGEFQLCREQPVMGATCDGGYAEVMLARSSGLVAIPDELASEEAAPILCAGIATFNALRKSGAEPGDLVAVFGIGGLGHMALQYARRMGFKVVAIGRRSDLAQDALALGAHAYIDANHDDVATALDAMGGARAIVATVGRPETVSKLSTALMPGGRLIILGASRDPLPVATGPLVRGEHAVLGSMTGSPYESERALAFSVLVGARPRIETLPLERAQTAYERIKAGGVRFRLVLTMARSEPR